jgi:hypothetical protein
MKCLSRILNKINFSETAIDQMPFGQMPLTKKLFFLHKEQNHLNFGNIFLAAETLPTKMIIYFVHLAKTQENERNRITKFGTAGSK